MAHDMLHPPLGTFPSREDPDVVAESQRLLARRAVGRRPDRGADPRVQHAVAQSLPDQGPAARLGQPDRGRDAPGAAEGRHQEQQGVVLDVGRRELLLDRRTDLAGRHGVEQSRLDRPVLPALDGPGEEPELRRTELLLVQAGRAPVERKPGDQRRRARSRSSRRRRIRTRSRSTSTCPDRCGSERAPVRAPSAPPAAAPAGRSRPRRRAGRLQHHRAHGRARPARPGDPHGREHVPARVAHAADTTGCARRPRTWRSRRWSSCA